MENIVKRFSTLGVLNGISFCVNEGEVLAVIGPSGSGKSTLLRCATLLETVDEGAFSYLGKPIATAGADGKSVYASPAVLKEVRNYFGLVFQNFNLFPHFSVLRNIIDAPITVQKRSKEEATETAMRLLEKMGLAARAGAYPCQLSGGEQQRVSIARALAMNPKILFFDEPTSALDPELTGEILDTIRALAQERMTMVVVTHEIAFARAVADRALFMEGGVVIEEGPAAEMIDAPESERLRTFLRRLEK
ncbi:amino acid ABC transporter ATP-binding protein [Christensenellaceae bacterium OttesenSCG-928-L17]|nr:amino acid ABC transporter ATP-binding protein [Christensenellaceae bacterium OttesenSCG-928-L17]